MPRKSAANFMIEFVQDYVDGKSDRLNFDLDFYYHLNENYAKMERSNPDLAECFLFYIAEQGFDHAQNLSDAAHRRLIRKQLNEFLAAMHDGFC